MSMSGGSCSIAAATLEVVADAVRVEHLDGVDGGGGRDLQDQAGDERAVAGLGVGVAVALDVPDVVAARRALDARRATRARTCRCRARRSARPGRRRAASCAAAAPRARRRAHGRARPALQARLAVEVDRRRRVASPTNTWLGATCAGPCGRLGRGLADAGERREDLLGRIADCGARVNRVMPNGRCSPCRQPVSTRATSARVARAGEDLAGPQQERVAGLVVDRDLARIPLAGQLVRGGGGGRHRERRDGEPRARGRAVQRSACRIDQRSFVFSRSQANTARLGTPLADPWYRR